MPLLPRASTPFCRCCELVVRFGVCFRYAPAVIAEVLGLSTQRLLSSCKSGSQHNLASCSPSSPNASTPHRVAPRSARLAGGRATPSAWPPLLWAAARWEPRVPRATLLVGAALFTIVIPGLCVHCRSACCLQDGSGDGGDPSYWATLLPGAAADYSAQKKRVGWLSGDVPPERRALPLGCVPCPALRLTVASKSDRCYKAIRVCSQLLPCFVQLNALLRPDDAPLFAGACAGDPGAAAAQASGLQGAGGRGALFTVHAALERQHCPLPCHPAACTLFQSLWAPPAHLASFPRQSA